MFLVFLHRVIMESVQAKKAKAGRAAQMQKQVKATVRNALPPEPDFPFSVSVSVAL